MFALRAAQRRGDPVQDGGRGPRGLCLLQPAGLSRHLLCRARMCLRTRRTSTISPSAYFDRAAADGVVHAEICFDPQTHTDRGIAFATVDRGAARRRPRRRRSTASPASLSSASCAISSENAAFETLAAGRTLAGPDRGGRARFIGGRPSAGAVRRASAPRGRKGLKLVAHAGEEGPPELCSGRRSTCSASTGMDHGNRSLEDDALVARLAREGMTLTVCPLSNLKLCVVDDMADHPIDRMLALGLSATVNSDDPRLFRRLCRGQLPRDCQGAGPARSSLAGWRATALPARSRAMRRRPSILRGWTRI